MFSTAGKSSHFSIIKDRGDTEFDLSVANEWLKLGFRRAIVPGTGVEIGGPPRNSSFLNPCQGQGWPRSRCAREIPHVVKLLSANSCTPKSDLAPKRRVVVSRNVSRFHRTYHSKMPKALGSDIKKRPPRRQSMF